MTPLDPRSVANLIIRISVQRRRPISNLSLQKIIYFIHGRHLIEKGEPLISGYFEAWPYGPVHPLIYDSFKEFGSGTLRCPATQRDIISGDKKPVDEPEDFELCSLIEKYASPYLELSAGRLVDLSHARNSPWDVATSESGDRIYGRRITDELVRKRFRYHKISVDLAPRVGEPNEESTPY